MGAAAVPLLRPDLPLLIPSDPSADSNDLHRLAASGFQAGTILADPPWKFLTRSERGEGRSASQHYCTQALDRIKALPVAQLAAPDAVLFLWVLDWYLAAALDVIAAWGFEHKTCAFTWVKQTESGNGWHMGQGYWTRANPEQCWLATRGRPKRLNADVRKLIVSPVMEHSRKPDETHERIEHLLAGLILNSMRGPRGTAGSRGATNCHSIWQHRRNKRHDARSNHARSHGWGTIMMILENEVLQR